MQSIPITMLLATALLLTPLAASAGDACPIDLTFYELGSPEGVDNAALLDGLASREAWLGISYGNSKAGVVVNAVSDKSPAKIGGLLQGDVVTTVNGVAVKKHPEMSRLLDLIAPGGDITLDIVRGDEKKKLAFKLGRHDPVFGRLVTLAAKNSCHEVRRGDIKEADRVKLVAKLFGKKGKLRCRTAHRVVGEADNLAEGSILMVRTAKKILITMPGEASMCVKVKSTDGKKLTARSIKRIFRRVVGDYLDGRHSNP
ncbi:MAG: hypothetical protein ACI9OJ_004036 [Myxococcota bacterium]|jgi:hypothetical protein